MGNLITRLLKALLNARPFKTRKSKSSDALNKNKASEPIKKPIKKRSSKKSRSEKSPSELENFITWFKEKEKE